MSQQASFTLNTVVYDPAGAPRGKPEWVNRAGGILNSFSEVTQDYREAVGGLKLTTASVKLKVPVVASTDTACTCAGTVLRLGQVEVIFKLDPNSTLAERTDLYLRFKDLVATGYFSGMIENLNPAYP